MIAIRLGLVIGVGDLQVLMIELAVAAWEQLPLSKISNGTAFHASFDHFGFNYPATQLRFPSSFAVRPVETICYFFGVDQGCADGPGTTT